MAEGPDWERAQCEIQRQVDALGLATKAPVSGMARAEKPSGAS
jgi:hypothetical protein